VKRPFKRSMFKCENTIKMDFKGIMNEVVNWICTTQSRIKGGFSLILQ
jgi:hypothetical protein